MMGIELKKLVVMDVKMIDSSLIHPNQCRTSKETANPDR